ncbi:hypothetical protein [uncultured Brevundimonas sp.]|uniref:hypothetical protein n=1 Tax=uncultured Brevundimonas sp. TaxID=213418 RepID=UPI0030EB54BA
MEDLFRSYWWLLFPLAWFVAAGFSSMLNYQRHKDALNLIKTYADKGQEPPAALLKMLDSNVDDDGVDWEDGTGRRIRYRRRPRNYWSMFGLFATLAIAFIAADYFRNQGYVSGGYVTVSIVMGALAFWTLIRALTSRGGRP